MSQTGCLRKGEGLCEANPPPHPSGPQGRPCPGAHPTSPSHTSLAVTCHKRVACAREGAGVSPVPPPAWTHRQGGRRQGARQDRPTSGSPSAQWLRSPRKQANRPMPFFLLFKIRFPQEGAMISRKGIPHLWALNTRTTKHNIHWLFYDSVWPVKISRRVHYRREDFTPPPPLTHPGGGGAAALVAVSKPLCSAGQQKGVSRRVACRNPRTHP